MESHTIIALVLTAVTFTLVGVVFGPRLTGWGRHEAQKADQALHDRIEHLEKHMARVVAWTEAWDHKLAQKAETTH